MIGENLDLLPTELVALSYQFSLDETSLTRVWPLDHVDPDGKTAYFRQQTDATYGSVIELNVLATPFTPPRQQWIP